MKRLSDYISKLKNLPNNAQFGALRAKTLLVIAPIETELVTALLAADAASLVVVGPSGDRIDDARVQYIEQDLFSLNEGAFDRIFFDGRLLQKFQSSSSIARLFTHLRSILKPSGAIFSILRAGVADYGFDVSNSIVRVAEGTLPTQAYLFDEILSRWSVRMMDSAVGVAPYEAIKFVRLAPKKPTLMLILGRSQAGKTSLARELIKLDRHMHVSNDYVYTEIVRKKRIGVALDISTNLLERVGDGSGTACGNFNRALEADPALLKEYLNIVLESFPSDKQMISMDFDMLRVEQVTLMKQFFNESGYSVWVVQR